MSDYESDDDYTSEDVESEVEDDVESEVASDVESEVDYSFPVPDSECESGDESESSSSSSDSHSDSERSIFDVDEEVVLSPEEAKILQLTRDTTMINELAHIGALTVNRERIGELTDTVEEIEDRYCSLISTKYDSLLRSLLKEQTEDAQSTTNDDTAEDQNEESNAEEEEEEDDVSESEPGSPCSSVSRSRSSSVSSSVSHASTAHSFPPVCLSRIPTMTSHIDTDFLDQVGMACSPTSMPPALPSTSEHDESDEDEESQNDSDANSELEADDEQHVDDEPEAEVGDDREADVEHDANDQNATADDELASRSDVDIMNTAEEPSSHDESEVIDVAEDDNSTHEQSSRNACDTSTASPTTIRGKGVEKRNSLGNSDSNDEPMSTTSTDASATDEDMEVTSSNERTPIHKDRKVCDAADASSKCENTCVVVVAGEEPPIQDAGMRSTFIAKAAHTGLTNFEKRRNVIKNKAMMSFVSGARSKYFETRKAGMRVPSFDGALTATLLTHGEPYGEPATLPTRSMSNPIPTSN